MYSAVARACANATSSGEPALPFVAAPFVFGRFTTSVVSPASISASPSGALRFASVGGGFASSVIVSDADGDGRASFGVGVSEGRFNAWRRCVYASSHSILR